MAVAFWLKITAFRVAEHGAVQVDQGCFPFLWSQPTCCSTKKRQGSARATFVEMFWFFFSQRLSSVQRLGSGNSRHKDGSCYADLLLRDYCMQCWANDWCKTLCTPRRSKCFFNWLVGRGCSERRSDYFPWRNMHMQFKGVSVVESRWCHTLMASINTDCCFPNNVLYEYLQ